MSSTEPLSASSEPLPSYRGQEYRAAVSWPLEPWLHTDPGRPPFLYRAVIMLGRHLLPVLFRLYIRGGENVPDRPCIIASNHQGWYDALFIISAFTRARPSLPLIYTMGREDTMFDRRWKRWLLPQLGVFPIRTRAGSLDERGVSCVYQILERGGMVLIFPEGRYSRGRELQPLKKGVGHFSLQAGAPICPVAISGLERLRLFGEVRISVGLPVWPHPPVWWNVNRRVAHMLSSVRRAILGAFDRGAKDSATMKLP
jgi:1-acyl-sn-glycerol-3-phosphate acyltransferase